MKKFVISGINLFEGGPLSIYYDCLDAIINGKLNEKYCITLFVHKKELFSKYDNYFEIIELPKSRKSYFYRLWYEYVFFKNYSSKYSISIWLSLHDITPRVNAEKIYTYCHNPSPFLKKDISKAKYSLKNVLFSFFYKYLYRINIKSAKAIIVQQDWLRTKFLEMYPISNVIVARPTFNIDYSFQSEQTNNGITIFLFPSFPRYFKNFEVICEACRKIKNENYEVWFTLDGTENAYSKRIYEKYSDINQIKWLGLKSREELFRLYNKSSCFIFPSILETWGLPISEYKCTSKPMFLADLPYAYEALGSYNKVCFFDPNNSDDLAKLMSEYMQGNILYDGAKESVIKDPYAKNWRELINIICE